MEGLPKDVLEAYESAKEVMKKAYSPYSKFKVGAAIRFKEGLFAAHNIENISFPAGSCAETIAINCVINLHGRVEFKYIVVVADSKDLISPCGICRQVMREHVSDQFKIYMGDMDGVKKVMSITELIPGVISSLD
ncbi:MAG: cytidine deaminase [Halobacteriovoraceae bacterium]|nr:cytidine deaminase [Halobacteriovoraceae bacterium]